MICSHAGSSRRAYIELNTRTFYRKNLGTALSGGYHSIPASRRSRALTTSGIESMYPMAPRVRNRDAHATFAGFVFQVNVTILDWLELVPGQHLELEAGEDIDLIQEAAALGLNDLSRLQQVKQLRKKRLTLRSDDALEAIANFCEHRRSKPGQNQEFR